MLMPYGEITSAEAKEIRNIFACHVEICTKAARELRIYGSPAMLSSCYRKTFMLLSIRDDPIVEKANKSTKRSKIVSRTSKSSWKAAQFMHHRQGRQLAQAQMMRQRQRRQLAQANMINHRRMHRCRHRRRRCQRKRNSIRQMKVATHSHHQSGRLYNCLKRSGWKKRKKTSRAGLV